MVTTTDYDTHCPTCDAPEPTHTPTCAVLGPTGSFTDATIECVECHAVLRLPILNATDVLGSQLVHNDDRSHTLNLPIV